MAFVWTIIFVAATLHAGLVKANLTCHATYLAVEKTAQITCYFGSHVSNETHESFSVVHYSDNNVAGLGKYVLECQYRAVKGDLLCDINANYTFNHKVKDHIILGIPNAAHFHSGTYVCHLIPSNRTVLPCILSIQVDDPMLEGVSPSSVKPAEEGSITSATPQPESHTPLEIRLSVTVGILVICIVCLLTAFFIFYFIFYRKRFSKQHQDPPSVGTTSHNGRSDGGQVPSSQWADGKANELQIKVDPQKEPPESDKTRVEAENNNLPTDAQPGDAARESPSEMDRLMSSADDSGEPSAQERRKVLESSAESEANSVAKLLKQQPKRRRRKRTSSERSQTSYKSVDSDPDVADESDLQDSSV